MPKAIINKVDNIGKKESQGKEFRFLNQNREPFDWTDEIPDNGGEFQGLLEEEAPFPDISSKLSGVILEDELVGHTMALEEEYEPAFEAKAAVTLDNADIQVDEQLHADQTQVDTVPIMVPQPHEIMYDVELGADEPDEGLEDPLIPPPIPDITGHIAGRYPTRSRRSVLGNLSYDRYLQLLQTSKILNDEEHEQESELITQYEDETAVMKYLLTQYNLKAGLKHLGEKGIAAAKGELTQLHVTDTWVTEDPTKLSRSEKVKALSYLMFLKEIRSGKVKGRACVNGAPQRAYISKEDAYSPTVANESVFITSVIAANKKRFVRCYKVPGAFLHT